MNLKEIKQRIHSVKSTQKITSAMKLVAAAKLRRTQASVEHLRPYDGRSMDDSACARLEDLDYSLLIAYDI